VIVESAFANVSTIGDLINSGHIKTLFSKDRASCIHELHARPGHPALVSRPVRFVNHHLTSISQTD
jgi:hypothetical protein